MTLMVPKKRPDLPSAQKQLDDSIPDGACSPPRRNCSPPPSPSTSSCIANTFNPLVIGSNGQTFIRAACKARNISDDHDASNAYLLIPECAPHGWLLECSHPLCVKKGRKFRYCAFCCRPVAQRNFYQRHTHSVHGDSSSGREELGFYWPTKHENETQKEVTEKPILCSSQSHRRFEDVTDVEPRPSKRTRLGSDGSPSAQENKKNAASEKSDDMTYLEPTLSDCTIKMNYELPVSSLTQEEINWMRLLNERPAELNNHSMGKVLRWLSSVMTAATPSTPCLPHVTFPTGQLCAEVEEEAIVDLDGVLGDFDQDLGDYEGDWGLDNSGLLPLV